MPVNTMASPASSAAAITSVIPHRAARLDQCRGTRFGRCHQTVSKGEERIGRHNRPLGQWRGQTHCLGHVLGFTRGNRVYCQRGSSGQRQRQPLRRLLRR